MPKLCSHEQCCGCSACYASCPRSAIRMNPDKEGFLRPYIDNGKCVNCQVCEKACPVLNRAEAREPVAVYAAKAKDNALRLASSSGGVFSLLARKVFKKGGIVYGAAMRETDLLVHHCSVENEEQLAALRGSKYVQSDLGDTYQSVKRQLATGRMVMFTGTPCQIAGLRSVLGKEYENLLLVDVVCHAAPSPFAWKKYLEKRTYVIEEGRDSARPEDVIDVRRISFRRKNCGWKRYSLSLRFANDKEYLGAVWRDPFLNGFLTELYNRPSCHVCPFKNLRSGSDLTIADYWNVHEKFPDMDDDMGTSLILVNTKKGEQAYCDITNEIDVRVSDYEDAVRINPSLVRSPRAHSNRLLFFFLVRFLDFDWLIAWLTTPSILKRCYRKLCRIVGVGARKA